MSRHVVVRSPALASFWASDDQSRHGRIMRVAKDINAVLSGAVPFLHLCGVVCGGRQMARTALVAQRTIAPGPIEGTEGLKRLSDPAQRDKFIGSVPLRREGTVDDIGQVAAFLASPVAAYVTGCVVVCDGGQNLVGSALFNLGAAQTLQAQARG